MAHKHIVSGVDLAPTSTNSGKLQNYCRRLRKAASCESGDGHNLFKCVQAKPSWSGQAYLFSLGAITGAHLAQALDGCAGWTISVLSERIQSK